MAEKKVENIIEALLLVTDKPLTMEDMRNALDGLDEAKIIEAIEILKEEYVRTERSFSIKEIAGGYQLSTSPDFAPWIGKLFRRDETRLSMPALETLAIIAYKQPLTRAEIEKIRGVSIEGVLKSLLDKSLIKVKGRKDAPGRPITYGTTDDFLKRFGLRALDSLPTLRDFTEHDLDFEQEGAAVKIPSDAEVHGEEVGGESQGEELAVANEGQDESGSDKDPLVAPSDVPDQQPEIVKELTGDDGAENDQCGSVAEGANDTGQTKEDDSNGTIGEEKEDR